MLNPYCSNKNCHLPAPEILNRLHQETDKTWKELANIFGVSERTIRRHAKSSDKPKQKRGRKRKIVGKVRNLLLSFTAYRSKDNTLTQQEMANRIREEEKVIISQQTVSRFLIKRRRTYKKIHPRWFERMSRLRKEL